MRISFIQTELYWQNPEANRAMLEEKIWLLPPTDLIVLPEMFTSGFTMQPDSVAEVANLTTTKWLKQMAAQTNAVLTGSFVVQENGKFYNRLHWVFPNGELKTYDKRHLFRMANENQYYEAGSQKLVVEWKNWRFCPLVCYDLRFPVWSRNQHLEYDCLIYVANFPATRANAWNVLLKARAIENLAYCVGVNRIGTDPNGIFYQGESAVIDFKGEYLFYQKDSPCSPTIVLDKKSLDDFRKKFPANLDADIFELK